MGTAGQRDLPLVNVPRFTTNGHYDAPRVVECRIFVAASASHSLSFSSEATVGLVRGWAQLASSLQHAMVHRQCEEIHPDFARTSNS